MKSLRDLLVSVLHEAARMCGTTSTRDVEYVSRRVEKEGDEFISITLGNFCDDFERSLAEGALVTRGFQGFRLGSHGRLPAFLQGFTSQVFDKEGNLLSYPSIAAIRAIRQICRFAKKVQLPCSSERIAASYEGYAQVENELALWRPDMVDDNLWEYFLQVSDILSGSLLFKPEELRFRHGTGAVAERLKMYEKYSPQYWYTRVERCFPAADLAFRSVNGWLDHSPQVQFVHPEQEQPVRVITVPKTLKGPRIIGVEPSLMQFLQQGVLRWMVPALEHNPLTRKSIRFSDQATNRELAQSSSRDGFFATLDLKEASDRVHKDVVYAMLRRNPQLRDAIFSCRSATSALPDGRIFPLQKFASMGSAMCFPIESMVFYTIILAAIHKAEGCRPTRSSILRMSDFVNVYGDDIIVPVSEVPFVLTALEQFCLKVNTAKSFWTGKFRESCGMDAYDGEDVTPTYLRHACPTVRTDVEQIASWHDTLHALYNKGYVDTAKMMHNCLEKAGVRLCRVPPGTMHSDLGYLTSPFIETKGLVRRSRDLHKSLIFADTLVDRTPARRLDGWSGYSRWVDLKGLSPRPVDARSVPGGFSTTAIKRRWTPII